MTTTAPASTSTSERGRPRVPLSVTVFIVGVSTLGAEIAAARLLSPWFGDSTIVWANTIAVVLVALAVGHSIGGKLADRNPDISILARIILGAGILMAAIPFVSDPFLRASVSAFDSLSLGSFAGSLFAVLVLVALPLILAGMVSPYALRLSLLQVDVAGSVSGRLSAISTGGSLIGTFAAALLLIPLIGTRRTFLVFALLLVLNALFELVGVWRIVAILTALVVVALMALPDGVLKAQSRAGEVIWERETEYQYARVIEDDDGERVLELNEGQAIHSIYRPGRYLTGMYYDSMYGLTLASPKVGQDGSRVAILGNAAGTAARALGHFYPQTRIDGVELDPAVTQAGRNLFDMQAPRLTTHADDARPWLRKNEGPFDAILIDAYRQPYIPFYLTTTEFFSLVRDRLAPGGVVVVNVGHVPEDYELEKVLAASMRTAFADDAVLHDPVAETNTMLVGLADAEADAEAILRDRVTTAPAELRSVLTGIADRLGPAYEGGEVYTDDKAPVEWLVDLSLAGVAGGGSR